VVVRRNSMRKMFYQPEDVLNRSIMAALYCSTHMLCLQRGSNGDPLSPHLWVTHSRRAIARQPDSHDTSSFARMAIVTPPSETFTRAGPREAPSEARAIAPALAVTLAKMEADAARIILDVLEELHTETVQREETHDIDEATARIDDDEASLGGVLAAIDRVHAATVAAAMDMRDAAQRAGVSALVRIAKDIRDRSAGPSKNRALVPVIAVPDIELIAPPDNAAEFELRDDTVVVKMVDSVDPRETASSALYFNVKRTASVGSLVDAWCTHCWQDSRPANLQFLAAVGFLNRNNVVQDLCAFAEGVSHPPIPSVPL